VADYFDRLELELRAAVPRATAHPYPYPYPHPHPHPHARQLRPARRRPRPGTVFVAVSVAVTAAVVVLAVALVGHAHNAARRTPPSSRHPSTGPATAAVPTLQQLLANFAVLRRPQTAADRSWQPDPDPAARSLPPATRLARTLPGGNRVFVRLEKLTAPEPGRPAGTYSMILWVVDRRGDSGSANFGHNVGYTISPMEFPAPGHQTGNKPTWTSLVPNGLARVSWTFACSAKSSPCLGRNQITLQVPVRGNIASASAPRTGGCIGTSLSCRPPATVTWYAPGGRIVDTFAGRNLMPAVAPFVQPAATSPPQHTRHRISDVLTGDGIGTVRFGESRVAVIAAVTRLLGPSSTGYGRANAVLAECGVDHTMTWPNWPVVSAHGKNYRLDPTLTVWFSHSRFVGYQYGEFRNTPAPRAPSRGTVLATTRGLTLGNKLARGRKLYGAAFRTSTAQGGVFLISAPAGRIDGFAWAGSPRYGDVSLHSLVATIDAGDVGCPALSP